MLFEQLESMSARPEPFSFSTSEELWADPHISEQMLRFHLDGTVDLASRTAPFIERSLGWITQLISLGNAAGARVLDLGCGPGLYANPLAQAGAEVVGVDFSERSLRHAEASTEASIRPTFVHGDYLQVDIPGTFDLILLAMWDFGALSPTQRQTLLERVHGWLRPTGRFVFDVHGLQSLRDRHDAVIYDVNLMNGFWSSERYHGFHRTFVYEDESLLLDKFDIFEVNRSRSIYNWRQHFGSRSITAELEVCGLAVESLHGDLTGGESLTDETVADQREFCVIATRA